MRGIRLSEITGRVPNTLFFPGMGMQDGPQVLGQPTGPDRVTCAPYPDWWRTHSKDTAVYTAKEREYATRAALRMTSEYTCPDDMEEPNAVRTDQREIIKRFLDVVALGKSKGGFQAYSARQTFVWEEVVVMSEHVSITQTRVSSLLIIADKMPDDTGRSRKVAILSVANRIANLLAVMDPESDNTARLVQIAGRIFATHDSRAFYNFPGAEVTFKQLLKRARDAPFQWAIEVAAKYFYMKEAGYFKYSRRLVCNDVQ